VKLAMPSFSAGHIDGVVQYLRTTVASISASWDVEHGADGRHHWHWTTPAFNANRYGSALTWTVGGDDRLTERYAVLGKTLIWHVRLVSTSTGGTAAAALTMRLPDGLRIASCVGTVAYAVDAGTAVAGGPIERVTASEVGLYRYDAGNWSNAAANNTNVYFQLIAELE
jgi:hypothetical protein